MAVTVKEILRFLPDTEMKISFNLNLWLKLDGSDPQFYHIKTIELWGCRSHIPLSRESLDKNFWYIILTSERRGFRKYSQSYLPDDFQPSSTGSIRFIYLERYTICFGGNNLNAMTIKIIRSREEINWLGPNEKAVYFSFRPSSIRLPEHDTEIP